LSHQLQQPLIAASASITTADQICLAAIALSPLGAVIRSVLVELQRGWPAIARRPSHVKGSL